jgi:hypothetical protein
LNVRGSFTGGDDIIMAAGTYSQHLAVVHCTIRNGCPWCGPRLMAGIACVGGVNVCGAFA